MNALPKWHALRRSFALFARVCRRPPGVLRVSDSGSPSLFDHHEERLGCRRRES
jgi:hypothetical protein